MIFPRTLNYSEALPASYFNSKLIGFRGFRGSQWGAQNIIKNIFIYGCYEGFAINGEHLILENCIARNNFYGYTFGNVDPSIMMGGTTHDLTLINCCDEINTKMPLFVNNGYATHPTDGKQAVTFISFNLELWHENQWQEYAKEVVPGTWYGKVEFTNRTVSGSNHTDLPFWEAGHGKNMRTINLAQDTICSTTTRRGYAPNYMQIIFDTTLNKPVICKETNPITWVDFNGIEVDN